MPAMSISNPFEQEFLPRSVSDADVHIYLYNRVCTLEQRIDKLQSLLEEQCEYCQYKKVAENIKSVLS